MEKSRFITEQHLFPHREEAQEECLHGHLASHSHRDLRDAFFIHVYVQSSAKKPDPLTRDELDLNFTISPHSLHFTVLNLNIYINK